MRRRVLAALAVAILVGTIGPAGSTPVATSPEQYQAYGRVFPDPQGCHLGEPGASPYAKGRVCALDFLQFEETKAGLLFLEKTFPRFVDFSELHRDFDCAGRPVDKPKQGCKDFKSVGLSVVAANGQAITRDRKPLYMVRVTDESVPDRGKDFFVFALGMHGIERAGVEGGTRAAEDLATWAACEAKKAPDFVDCESEQNKAPHPLLEATPKKSLTAGEVLRRSVVYFVYPNSDGWVRGDRTTGPQSYQRYNGNGVDLNRDWPELGFTFRPYTPWSEPETRAFGRVLQAVGPKDGGGRPKWTGGIDLHGQLVDRAFSFTLIGGSERPFDKNQRVLETVKGAWADAEKRLAWSPIIKPNSASRDDPRLYGVQWGTVWDTIDYTVTGAMGDWIDSPIGLNADGIDNEMSASHVSNCGVGSCWSSDLEQLHVDGNKSLIYAMINYSLIPEDNTFPTGGKVAYVVNDGAVSAPAAHNAPPPSFARLDPQKNIDAGFLAPHNDYTYEFKVKGPKDGVYNGGIEVLLTCASAQGVSPCALDEAVLEHKDGKKWKWINSYFNQSPLYIQAGKALHANLPLPGRYRVRITDGGTGYPVGGVYRAEIRFTREKGWPDPGQVGYRVTNMNFWKELAPFTKPRIDGITPEEVERSSSWMNHYDTVVVTNKVYPELAGKLHDWVERFGGNLVLTDSALNMLEEMGVVARDSVDHVTAYAGYVNFATQDREETYKDPLARKINQPGAAEGQSGDEVHRRQLYEPVPLGYAIQQPDGGDAETSPVWLVRAAALKKSQGDARAVATTRSLANVSYGEIKLGQGRIRFLGALLPMPTEAHDHTFGLADYALTYSGYQLLQNALSWTR